MWPRGFQEVSASRFHDIRHVKVVRLSASRTGHLYPQECSWYSFSLGAESPQGHGKVGRNMSLKKPVTPPGIDPGTVRLVAQRPNHYVKGELYLIFSLLYPFYSSLAFLKLKAHYVQCRTSFLFRQRKLCCA